MSSFEPVIILYGSPQTIENLNIQLPITFLFAFNIDSLKTIVNPSTKLSEPCLKRYFLILFDLIEQDLYSSLKLNHSIISIYDYRHINSDVTQNEFNQMVNTYKQLSIDITHDIIKFLTIQGDKQYKLDRVDLVKIYYKRAQVLKEWIMSSFRAEPCHILLIPLNSSLENLNNTQEKLQDICNELGFQSTIIRQFNDYIPSKTRHSSLLPYSQLLYNYEDPKYICKLLRNLCSIRLYLYGNTLCRLNDWSNLMIENEDEIMNDEDNWCAFIENEPIDNDIKWNFGFIFGKNWMPFRRITPLNFDQLKIDPRFHSALNRSYRTYASRQIEVTAKLFDWYADNIQCGSILIEPQLTNSEIELKTKYRERRRGFLTNQCIFNQLHIFDYKKFQSNSKKHSIKIFWLDELITNSNEWFQSYECQYFNKISLLIIAIEKQLRENSQIFLIVSGYLGEELFLTVYSLMQQIHSIYIYCAQIEINFNWSKYYSEIKGIFNDFNQLQQKIQQDYEQLENSFTDFEQHVQILNRNIDDIESLYCVGLTVYNHEQKDLFFGHQRTIDTLLSMPHTDESRKEMMEEFRKIYKDNQTILNEIDIFEQTYQCEAAVQWSSKDSFISRTINKILRLSDVDQMFKFRYILTDIYQHLNQSHRYNSNPYSYYSRTETYYRGQVITKEQFEYLKQLRGNILSINTFLSTTSSMQVALMYAGKHLENNELISIIFSIECYSSSQTRPYANISQYSAFSDEDETLFAMGTIFKMNNIRRLTSEDNIWVIYLTIVSHNDPLFHET